VQEVNQLLKQYAMMKKQFKSLSKGGGLSRKLAGMRFR
jgi:signal recognition particle GTPase